jgi:curved DNA-binding protein
MKYKDYYEILGVARDADLDAIKKAYRKLAHKYHPDVSKDVQGEAKFKEIGEAYATLKDAEKRAAYDQLGRHAPGEDFRPPPDWGSRGDGQASFDGVDLSDLFAHFGGGAPRGARRAAPHGPIPIPGEDYEVKAEVSLEDSFHGTVLELSLSMPEYDAEGYVRRVPRNIKARIPKGATDGQRLRLRGKGGSGFNGGPDGDLYLNIALKPHALFRASGHDLFIDLPLAPWEAVLGAAVTVPTLGGAVQLKVPAGTQAGQKLRLSGRGLPKPHQGQGQGDLFAIVQIAVPAKAGEKEKELYQQLAATSGFDPRGHFKGVAA